MKFWTDLKHIEIDPWYTNINEGPMPIGESQTKIHNR